MATVGSINFCQPGNLEKTGQDRINIPNNGWTRLRLKTTNCIYQVCFVQLYKIRSADCSVVCKSLQVIESQHPRV